MEKYKICPTCGTKNPPMMIECMECETDLTSVPIGRDISDGEKETDRTDTAKTGAASSVPMVRICTCGTRNPAAARKCIQCGEDISDLIPEAEQCKKEQEKQYLLSSLDGAYVYELSGNFTVVGRENEMREYLSAKPYVSRKHAEFCIEADKLWVKNHSNTNHTYVNNRKIDEYTELHDGDVIGLGGKEVNGTRQNEAAYFYVRIGACI